MTAELTELADRPFELLAALDARLRAGADERGLEAARLEWSGLAFRVDGERLLAPRADVREVLEPPARTRVPAAKPWLLGIANVRGDLLPVIDLSRYLGGQGVEPGIGNRVVVLNDDEVPAGFLVDEVAGFRNFTPEDQRHELVAEDDSAAAPYVLGAFVRDGADWKVFSLRKVAADPAFRDAGA